MDSNPYLAGLELVKQHSGTSGQVALAKCILSLYNREHAFSMSEILGPLDTRYTEAVLAMVKEYAVRGETPELCAAGKYVFDNFPGLVELSRAMSAARNAVRQRWEDEREAEIAAEEEAEETRQREREAKAKSLYCEYCKQHKKHLPSIDALYECQACGTERSV